MNIDLITKDFKKEFGEGTITLATETPEMDIISSGSISIDYATGVGGYPRGSFIEILAEEGVGKTSLSYYAMAEAQKKGLKTLFINLEGLYDNDWAEEISGLNGEEVMIASPEPGMQSVELLQRAVHSGEFGLIVLDSVGGMINDSEVFDKKGKPGKIQVGGAASLVTTMVTRNLTYARKNGTTVIFLNQLRDTMDSMYPMQHGPGGRAIRHAASIIIRLKSTSDVIKDNVDGNDIVVARRISATISKNKVGAPNAVATYMFYNRWRDGVAPGIDREQEIVDLALKTGIIQQSGSFYKHDVLGEKGQFQGKDAVREYLRENEEAFETVRKEVIQFAREKKKDVQETQA